MNYMGVGWRKYAPCHGGDGGVEGKLNESVVASYFEQADLKCNRQSVNALIIKEMAVCVRLVTSKT
jgi:hypothetical protein